MSVFYVSSFFNCGSAASLPTELEHEHEKLLPFFWMSILANAVKSLLYTNVCTPSKASCVGCTAALFLPLLLLLMLLCSRWQCSAVLVALPAMQAALIMQERTPGPCNCHKHAPWKGPPCTTMLRKVLPHCAAWPCVVVLPNEFVPTVILY